MHWPSHDAPFLGIIEISPRLLSMILPSNRRYPRGLCLCDNSRLASAPALSPNQFVHIALWSLMIALVRSINFLLSPLVVDDRSCAFYQVPLLSFRPVGF